MSKVVCIIPARMASTRFPGKPLAKMLGHSMIEHVYRRVCLAEHVDEVYIATCDQEIADEAERFGAQAIMTSATHTRGTDRVAEAAQKIEGDIIINVQGDEPLVDPKSLDEAIVMMKENPQVAMR
ncbi:MAG: NTP transferase domain-containing protein [Candidatus Omnitrophica bacterium]|nr:NTP transferase domain-containing protein [Candidatus Omnitrophota bacterium]